jgi:GNAT superfamily N-acetyltransferase
MEGQHLELLDNPVWNSLQTRHSQYGIGVTGVQKYPADMLPFIAFENKAHEVLQKIEPYTEKNKKLYIVGILPEIPANWTVSARLDCAQMVCLSPVSFTAREELQVTRLGDADEMLEFINTVLPGFFKKRTPLLGNYYGIRVNGELVAMAGERLNMTGLTEVSAVGTHPAHTGKGFAKYLITYLCQKIQKIGDIPFLHVLNTNERAIGLYKSIGFEKRRDMPFWPVFLLNNK